MALVITLRLQLPRLIGLNFFMSFASGSLDIRVIIAKLILEHPKNQIQNP
jgi:hypothetical protein